jgi:hypothetical protein
LLAALASGHWRAERRAQRSARGALVYMHSIERQQDDISKGEQELSERLRAALLLVRESVVLLASNVQQQSELSQERAVLTGIHVTASIGDVTNLITNTGDKRCHTMNNKREEAV